MQYTVNEFSFPAMNTEVKVITVNSAGPSAPEELRQLFLVAERRFSRFQETSELSRLNHHGELNPASRMMLDVLESSKRYFGLTGGMFNPTVLGALEAAGYERSFESLDPGEPVADVAPFKAADFNFAVEIDGDSGRVRSRARLDLGGIVKGWTVDRAANALRPACDGWLIDAGGDICAGGESPDPCGWVIGIDSVFTPGVLADVIRIDHGGVATSSVVKRSWWRNGSRRHHIIDPRTSRPASTRLAAVNVVAESAELADVLAKASVVLGEQAASALVEKNGGQARFTRADGAVSFTDGWPSLLARQAGGFQFGSGGQ